MDKKKARYVAGLWVVLALGACTSDEPYMPRPSDPGEYITFGVPGVGTADTRAALEAFPDGGQFQVLGYLKSYTFTSGGMEGTLDDGSVSTSWEAKADVTPPSVFGTSEDASSEVNTTGTTVTYQNGYCTYANPQHWNAAEDARYSFYYYYPAADSGFFTTTFGQVGGQTVGLPNLTFTMPFRGGDGNTSRDMNSVPDAMYGFSEDVMRSTVSVVPQFRHLLAGLRMQVNNYNTRHGVTITGLRVYGSDFRRDITLNSDFTTTMSGTFGGSFQFVTDGSSVTVPKVEETSEGETAVGNSAAVGGTLLLVPYKSSNGRYFGDDAKVEVTYTFDGGQEIRDSALAFGLDINPGTIYTLQLNFVGSDLVLEFIVDNNQQWVDGNDSNLGDYDDNENITFE